MRAPSAKGACFRQLLALAVAVAGLQMSARAAEVTDVATAFERGNPIDVRFRIGYSHEEKRAQLQHELEGQPGQQAIGLARDLTYQESQDLLALRAEIGIYHNLSLHVELPVYLSQSESYGFASTVNSANSPAVGSGLVPPDGFDAQHNGIGLPPNSGLIFRGVQRGARGGAGLDAFDTLNFGVSWAPFSQAKDDTKPTWVVGAEAQLSIGNIKEFDRNRPDANHGVSEGLHRLIAHTAVSHRFRYLDPYFGLWYLFPIARSGSLFRDYGPAQASTMPQQQAGATFGVEYTPFARPAEGHRITLDMSGRLDGHFEGLGYSEAWQLFASSPALRCDPAQNPACDPRQTSNGYQGQPYTGISFIQSYATLGADVGVLAQIGQHAQLKAGFDYAHDQAHFITGDNIGAPSTPGGRVMSATEYNPAYRAVIDQVGHRYRVDDVNVYNAYFWAQLMF